MNARKQLWLTALVTAILFMFAACSGAGDPTSLVTGEDVVGEQSGVDNDTSASVSIDSVPDEEPDGADIDLAPPVITNVENEPAASSPAARQAAQSSSGAVAEPEPIVVTDEPPSVTETSNADRVPEPSAAEIIEIPVFPPDSDPIDSDANEGSNDQAQDAAISGNATLSAEELEGCSGACEVGGLEFDPASGPADSDTQDAPSRDLGAEPAPVVFAEADLVCPEGSAADCVEQGGGVQGGEVTEVPQVTVEEEPEQVDCALQPWARGCDGPVPEPGDYEAQEVVPDEAVETDETTGVFVPQELQDLLLEDLDR